MQYKAAADLFRTGAYGIEFLNQFMEKVGNDSRVFRAKLGDLSSRTTTQEEYTEFVNQLGELARQYKRTSKLNARIVLNYVQAIAEGYLGGFLKAGVKSQADVDSAIELRNMFAARIRGKDFAVLIESIITQVDTLAGLAVMPQLRQDVQRELSAAIREVEGIANAFSLLEEFFVRVYLLINKRMRDSGFVPPDEPEMPMPTASALRSARRSFEPMGDEEIVIWRYFDFPKFIALLERGELYIPTAETLTRCADALEGEFTNVDKDLFSEMFEDYPSMKQVLSEMGDDLKRITYVSSWHIRDDESKEMWKAYTKSNGVAIRTTAKRLLSSLQASVDVDVYATRVNYIDPTSDRTTLQGILSPFINKVKSFAFERELRVMFVDPLRATNSTALKIDLAELCEQVVVNPDSEEWIRELIEYMLRKRGILVPVTVSSLNRNEQ